MSPITREEFSVLPREKPPRALVSNEELLEQLAAEALTTKEVASFLGVQNGTAYSRLKRLLTAGSVEVAYEGAKAFWIAVIEE